MKRTIKDYLDSLPADRRERELGRLEGMSMAMRICRNRAEDEGGVNTPKGMAAEICQATIRFVQVQLGSGRQSWQDMGGLTEDELDELWRIWT